MSAEAEPAPLDVGGWLRRLRGPAVFVAIGISLVSLFAAIGRSPHSGRLDPRNPAPDGTRALAALLAGRGDIVTVADRVSDLGTAPDTTIVISDPLAVTDDSLRAIAASRATIAVVEPDDRALAALGVDATVSNLAPDDTIDPGCALPAAVAAGNARISGILYRSAAGTAGVTTCYPGAGGASLLVTTRPSGGRTAVIGSPTTLTNQNLADDGDAALALGLLDNPHIDWAPASLQAGAAPKSRQGLLNLLPPRILWAALQLFIAVILVALWRARRLGPLVTEPLPVVVRAAETVEGAGRLLHAARARTGAATALRTATVERLARLLHVRADSGSGVVVPAVAEHTGRQAATVEALLYGGAPGDDAALVQLGIQLASLEAEARRVTPLGGLR